MEKILKVDKLKKKLEQPNGGEKFHRLTFNNIEDFIENGNLKRKGEVSFKLKVKSCIMGQFGGGGPYSFYKHYIFVVRPKNGEKFPERGFTLKDLPDTTKFHCGKPASIKTFFKRKENLLEELEKYLLKEGYFLTNVKFNRKFPRLYRLSNRFFNFLPKIKGVLYK